jgi:hypothetical protein
MCGIIANLARVRVPTNGKEQDVASDAKPVLVLLGEPQPGIALSARPSIESPITGEHLRAFGVQLSIQGDSRNELLQAELTAQSLLTTVLVKDVDGGNWRVDNRVSSYTQGTHVFHHAFDIVEHEQIELSRVEFEGLVFTPEKWSINGGDPLHLEFMVTLDEPQNSEFEKVVVDAHRGGERRAFEVRMVGVRDQPVVMRFGRCYWEVLDDGRVRHAVNLFVPTEEKPRASLFEPEIPRLQELAITQGLKLDALLAELKAAGVLDDGAIGRIAESTQNPPVGAWRVFDRTRDVTRFMDI